MSTRTSKPTSAAEFVARDAERQAGEIVQRKGTKLRSEQRGNVTVVTAESRSIKTVVDLLDAAGIDRRCLDRDGDTEFVVERSKANKYDQIFGLRDGPKATPIVVPLWQVWAELRRRKAAPVEFAPVAPISIRLPKAAKVAAPARSMRCALILPDSQHGFRRHPLTGALDPLHDRRAVDVALQLAAILQPDRIVLLGDMLDLPEWSDKFLHGPEFAQTTQAAGIDLAWCIARLRAAAPAAEIDYIEGNHEHRLTRAIMRNAVAACGLTPARDVAGPPLLSIERFLGLAELGVAYHGDYPHGELWLNDNTRVSHGHIVRGGAGETARAILADARSNEVFGHLHHQELVAKTTHPRRGQVTYYAFCPGTLARIDGAVPAATPRVNWQQGLGVIWYEAGNGLAQFEPVPIYGGRAVWQGRIIEGQDYGDKLAADTGRAELR